jgi:hypothetical protein
MCAPVQGCQQRPDVVWNLVLGPGERPVPGAVIDVQPVGELVRSTGGGWRRGGFRRVSEQLAGQFGMLGGQVVRRCFGRHVETGQAAASPVPDLHALRDHGGTVADGPQRTFTFTASQPAFTASACGLPVP